MNKKKLLLIADITAAVLVTVKAISVYWKNVKTRLIDEAIEEG